MKMLTNAPMTLYQLVIKDGDSKYIRVPISKVHWEGMQGITMLQSTKGMKSEDLVIVYIPLSNLKGQEIQAEDIIVKGGISEDFTNFPDFKERFKDVFVVTQVTKNDFGRAHMQHLEVRGK